MMKINQLQDLQIKGLKFIKQIDRGSFGVVYQAISLNKSKKYAVKVQPNTTKTPQLNFQFDVYNYLLFILRQGNIPNIYIPQVYGLFSDSHYTFMVMELLGKNIYQVSKQETSMSDKTKVYLYASRMLIIIHFLHLANFVYRDIKPENFLLKLDENETLVLVDFGLCKKEAQKKQRQKYNFNRTLIGTSRYASINSHEGKQVTKIDDIESLCYVIIYLLKGRLPWQGIKKKSQAEKNQQILKIKKRISVEQLCEGLPKGIYKLMSYVRNLPKEETIDNYLLVNLIKEARKQHLKREQNVNDGLSQEKIQQQEPQKEEINEIIKKNVTPKKKNELSAAEKSSQGSSMNQSYSMKNRKKTTKKPLVKRQFLIKEDPNDSISQSQQSQAEEQISKFVIY